jgi:hypothetical protein
MSAFRLKHEPGLELVAGHGSGDAGEPTLPVKNRHGFVL